MENLLNLAFKQGSCAYCGKQAQKNEKLQFLWKKGELTLPLKDQLKEQ